MVAQQITIIDPMTESEARGLVMRINSHGAEIGRMLRELREREGWRSLGYETWTDCLDREFAFTRKHLYELMRAAPVQEQLSPMGYKVSADAAVALSEYPEYVRPVIAQAAEVRGGITAGRVRRMGDAIMPALMTGYTDTGSGESTALDAALDLEEQEAVKRRKQYMNDDQQKQQRVYIAKGVVATIARRGLKSIEVVVKADDPTLLDGLSVMDEVVVSVWRKAADAE